MTLKQAVKEVIRQNEQEGGFRPSFFIEITKNGEAENLDNIISELVINPDILPKIIYALEKHRGKPIFIEEFIATHDFALPNIVVEIAIERNKHIQQVRNFFKHR